MRMIRLPGPPVRALFAAALALVLVSLPGCGESAQDRATARLLRRELAGIRAHHAVDAHLRPSIFPSQTL